LSVLPFNINDNGVPGGLYTPKKIDFLLLNRNFLKNLDFEVRTNSGRKYQFFHGAGEEMMLTLLFRKKMK